MCVCVCVVCVWCVCVCVCALLRYSFFSRFAGAALLNCVKLRFFFYINLHSIHHNGKAKTDLSQLCKCIKMKT